MSYIDDIPVIFFPSDGLVRSTSVGMSDPQKLKNPEKKNT